MHRGTTSAGYGSHLNSHVVTDLFITAASNHPCYLHHHQSLKSWMLFSRAQQFQFLPSPCVLLHTWIEQKPWTELGHESHSTQFMHQTLCVILWCVSFIAWNQTRSIAQDYCLSGASVHHATAFYDMVLHSCIRLPTPSKFSSWLAQVINIVSLFVQSFDIELDALQFLKRVFSVDTLVKPLPPVMAYSVSRNINFFFRIFTQFWGKFWW